MTAAPAILLDGVAKRYGALAALGDVSLRVAPGEVVALAGHNGAGKTTLVKLVLGLLKPSAGTILVLGENLAGAGPALRRRIGFLPETLALSPVLTGEETLVFYAGLKGEPRAAAQQALDRLGLAHAAQRRVGTYSKGMRQRLGLAQALLGRPQLLLLDEPTTGLDPDLRRAFYAICREARDNGCAILLSTHALGELDGNADRVVILERGKMVANGSIDELAARAGLPVTVRLKAADGATAKVRDWLQREGSPRALNGRTFEIDIAASDKLRFLERAARDRPGIADIALAAAGIDEIYRHFLRGGDR